MQTPTDTQLHELAHKRVEFKAHLIVYCLTNTAFWLIWYVTGHGYVWPIWPLAGWGVGLLFHYLFEYRSSRFLSEDEEYKKLKSKMEEHQHLAQ
jgi:hypothetical protein